MRAVLLAMVMAAAIALPGCQYCVAGPSPHAVADQPVGARCMRPAECAGGLSCMSLTCTISCAASAAACPAGSICAEAVRDGSGALLSICVKACASDADCLMGATVGTCLTAAGYCMPRRCTNDDACGGQGRCVGTSEARGITWNEFCEDGYCQL